MPNALASETSPYLLQHAENPVAWLPWGEAAFAKARAEEKPIFLSIGYSTCHWCHVMARESFEDADTAAILNEHFVSIKVDREERPDVDKVYMTYVQALTGQGGWPLSAWLTADLKPFYGGTYFPPVDHPGRVGFPSLLRAIAHAWATERPKLIAEADRVIHTLKAQAEAATSVSAPDDGFDIVDAAGQAFEQGYESLRQSFDEANGGFGGAPKFPRASNLNFLLRCAVLQGLESETGREAVRMTATTMEKMAAGGIHDHVGGGFHRYAVDGAWFVPHFEKMLGDQAQIAMNALDAHLYTGREEHAWLARAVFDYVLRDLTSPQGGFFSAEDADSADPSTGRAHAEGAFYVWTRAEVEAVLGADALLVCDHFGIRAEGNVPAELDPHGDLRGRNILQQRQSIAVTAKSHGLSPEAASDRLVAALDTLRSARERRPRPLRDEKIITAWNGLMISALVRGAGSPAACLADQRTRYETAAVAAARFIERELYDNERGILYRHHRHGRGASEGFAEDYAFLISGLLDLYEVSFAPEWLLWARRLQATMDARFRDEANGGYFNSAADDPSIVLRLKEDHDGAEPSPNSIATANLLRLADCFHDDGLREKARSTLRALRDRWTTLPHALPEMLCSLERMLEVPRQVVFAGDRHSPQFAELVAVARERPGPRRALLAADPVIAAELPWLQPLVSRDGQAVAYVCENHACQLPARTPAELRARLGE